MKGKTDIEKLSRTLLNNWLDTERGEGLFRYAGGYWEVLHPILKKYAPDLLKKYENLIGEEFEYFNPRVKELLTTGDEEKDIKNAIKYINHIMMYSRDDEIHYIDDEENDDVIMYIPNLYIDPTLYRE